LRYTTCMITHILTDLFDVLLFETNNPLVDENFTPVIQRLVLNTPLLEEFKTLKKQGISINIFTSAPPFSSIQLEKLGLLDFNKIFSTITMGHSKRDFRAFRDVAKELEVKPAQIFFLDDQIRHTNAAIEAGYQAATFTSNHQIIEKLKNLQFAANP